jgi:hypothetical protein
MAVRIFRWISVVCAGVTLGALSAHVLELPNKLSLDAPLWLAIQQNLYQGWGPMIGMFEVAAIVSAWTLTYLVRNDFNLVIPTVVAATCLNLALVVFFSLNAPVNDACATWTVHTIPANWTEYRARWEAGHAVRFVLVLAAFVTLLATSRRPVATLVPLRHAAV